MLTAFWNLVRGILAVVLMGLLALIIASLWPIQLERIGRAVEEAPLTSFGAGLLALILASLAAVLLAITICLSPFAFVGMVVVGVGVLLGWVALGLVLGQRVLTGLFNQASPKVVTAAIVGTLMISLILTLSRVFGLLHTLLIFLLVPPAAGAVLLTRFGSIPYATRGTRGTHPPDSSGPSTGSSSGGIAPRPSAPHPPAPREGASLEGASIEGATTPDQAPIVPGPRSYRAGETSSDEAVSDEDASLEDASLEDAPSAGEVDEVRVENAVLVGA